MVSLPSLQTDRAVIPALFCVCARASTYPLARTKRSLYSLMGQPVAANLVVNATSVSSHDESPEFADLVGSVKFTACELLMDLNYGRIQNFWRLSAHRNDIPFMDGLPALAYQARRSFELWTGIKVPPEEFLNALGTETIETGKNVIDALPETKQ